MTPSAPCEPGEDDTLKELFDRIISYLSRKNILMKKLSTLSLLLFVTFTSFGQSTFPDLLSERDRARVVDEILEDRLDNLLPKLMQREEIDMWILISREYNEDPVMKTILPSTWLSARRRTIMVFFNKGEEGIDKVAIARYNVGKLLKGEWNLDVFPDQWEALMSIIKDRNPKKIGLNFSEDFALADGLVRSEYETFMEKLPKTYHDRVVSAQSLAIAWLETRSQKSWKFRGISSTLGKVELRKV